MTTDTCVMPDGDCSGCNHCDHDEVICVAPEYFKKTCSTDCGNCDYCDEGEAFCDLDTIEEIEPCTEQSACVFCPFLFSVAFEILFDVNLGECRDKTREEMRRYLYRNVAMEYRKSLSDFHHIPDIPGWS